MDKSLNSLILALVIFFSPPVHLITYSPCELAQELTKIPYNVSFWEIPTWVCVAYNSSGLNTSFEESGHYGIFAINGNQWCEKCVQGDCRKFTDDNLSDDIECVINHIYPSSSHTGGYYASHKAYSMCTEPWKVLQAHECHKVWTKVLIGNAFVRKRQESSEEEDVVVNDVHEGTHVNSSDFESTYRFSFKHVVYTESIFLVFSLAFIFVVATIIHVWRMFGLPLSRFCS